MTYLYKKVPNNRTTTYRLKSCSLNAVKDGIYHVLELEEGSPLIRQLKVLYGFSERKERQTYNAIKDINKSRQEVKRSIVDSAEKVEKVKPKKKRTTKKKSKSSLSQSNTKL